MGSTDESASLGSASTIIILHIHVLALDTNRYGMCTTPTTLLIFGEGVCIPWDLRDVHPCMARRLGLALCHCMRARACNTPLAPERSPGENTHAETSVEHVNIVKVSRLKIRHWSLPISASQT